jgi:hypothetical protein
MIPFLIINAALLYGFASPKTSRATTDLCAIGFLLFNALAVVGHFMGVPLHD